MATAGYEGMPDDFMSAVTIDKFLFGCNEKGVALVTLNKDPKTPNEAMQFMKGIINSQKNIGEVKKYSEIKLQPNMENRTLPPSKPTTILESRISKIKEKQQEQSNILKEIINYLREQERRTQN
jgi:hypothetical protein